MLMQVVSILGALLVLGAFAGNQLDRIQTHSYTYQLMNLFGAGALTVAALATGQAGLIIVEGSWTLISVGGLVKVMRGSRQ